MLFLATLLGQPPYVHKMFCNGDIMEVYHSWGAGTARNPVLDIVLGVLLFAVGLVGAYLLVRYQRKKDAEKAQDNAHDWLA